MEEQIEKWNNDLDNSTSDVEEKDDHNSQKTDVENSIRESIDHERSPYHQKNHHDMNISYSDNEYENYHNSNEHKQNNEHININEEDESSISLLDSFPFEPEPTPAPQPMANVSDHSPESSLNQTEEVGNFAIL